MKLIPLCCVAVLLHFSVTGFSQTITLSGKQLPLKQALNDIRKQTGYEFFYETSLLDHALPVTVDLKQASIPAAMDVLLKNQSLSYSVNRKTILITTKPRTAGQAPEVTPPADSIRVKGIVRSSNGDVLTGVSVMIKGADRAVQTDAQGNFTIKTVRGKILTITHVGFAPQELTITGGEFLNITLSAAVSGLDEVIVIGYGTQKKGDLTGSVSTIKENEIRQSKAVSFMEAMQGRAAGVQVTSSSGEPGAGVTVNIRGANSFSSGTQPLYVIDGVQVDINNDEVARSNFGSTAMSNPLSGINPADIVSIEILKDASATAIFGSRGANGVIMVTTKSGKANTSVVEVNAYAGLSERTRKFDMIGPQAYAEYRFATNPADLQFAIDKNGDNIGDTVRDVTKEPSHDWQDEVLRRALTQSYHVSYSGGSAKTTFSINAGYLNQEGLVRKNKFERYTVGFKVNHNASNKIRLGATLNASHGISSGAAGNGGNGVMNWNGLFHAFLLYRPVGVPQPGQLLTDPDGAQGAQIGSPIDFINFSYKTSPLTRLQSDLSADYKISKGLTFTARAGAIFTFSANREFYPATTSWGFADNGIAMLNNSESINWYQTNTLTYNTRFGKDHLFTAMGGFELNDYDARLFNMQGRGFDIQSINVVDNIATAKVLSQLPNTSHYGYNRVSVFGRVNYGWRDRYLLTATLRQDGSSKFGVNHKYALFPSGAIAWKMSNEPFMKKQKVVSDAKLRASFGVTGNDRIPPYQSLANTANAFYSNANGGSSIGAAPNTPENPALKWETTYQYDAGIDLSFFKGKINLTADVYLKKTKDLLIEADVSGQTGYMKQWRNMGQVDNKGLELTLNTENIHTRNFNWNTNFNISFNKNKVRSLGNVSYLPVTVNNTLISQVGRVIAGEQIGTGYGYVFSGVYQLSDFDKQTNGTYLLKQGVAPITGRTVQPGDLKFKDVNGDGVVNSSDYAVISNSNPLHYGGLSNNFQYKNFELSVMLQWSYGNDLINTSRYKYELGSGNIPSLSADFWYNRWTPTNPTNTHPALLGQGKLDMSSYYVADGSFLRMKNVTLAYVITPKAFLKKAGITACRVYLTAENLYTWTGYYGFDPEVVSYSQLLPGIDNIAYPRSKTFTLGLTVKF